MRYTAMILAAMVVFTGCASPDLQKQIAKAADRYATALIEAEQAKQEAKAAEAKEREAAAEKAAAAAAEAAARRKADQAAGGLSGSQQFIWKPVSEKGALVVLLPAAIEADECLINGSIPGAKRDGRANGNRIHFRWPEKGGYYGKDITVTAKQDGEVVGEWSIPDGAKRVD